MQERRGITFTKFSRKFTLSLIAVYGNNAHSQPISLIHAPGMLSGYSNAALPLAATRVAAGLASLLCLIDTHSKDDLTTLSHSFWWTIPHLLIISGAVLLVSGIIFFWAVALRRRVAQQKAMIERTMNLERERRRLLDAINSETRLDQLLMSVCRSIESLVPGLTCCCAVTAGPSSASQISVGYSPERVLMEVPLTDPKGNLIGMFVAGGYEIDYLTAQEQETIIAGAGIANLGVNQRRLVDELNYTLTHDQLTGLPNRRLSDSMLDEALRSAAASGKKIGVAYVDIDDFKQINDQHGHKSGDLYLQQIAERLSARVRTTDKLARVGGDEFLLIATGLKSVEDAEDWRRRLLSSFDHSFILDRRRVIGSASVGVAVFPDHGSNAEELKRRADEDMYAAKHRRREEQGRWPLELGESEIFSPADLTRALEAGSFSLVYQPQFSSRGKLRAVEALLRLNDPIFGTVMPDAFIRVAECNDLIIPLGAWVIRQALADAVSWGFERLPDLRIIVNVAARQIEHPGFADDVFNALEAAGLPPAGLEFEITERTLTRDVAQTMRQLKRLSAAGVRLALDDFGTEHASLKVLHNYPIDTLKIDRSFIMVLHSQPEIQPIVRAIVSLGHALGKRVVAEGVETRADVDTLLGFGEMDLQGYLFSRPIAAEEVYGNLSRWQSGLFVGGMEAAGSDAHVSNGE